MTAPSVAEEQISAPPFHQQKIEAIFMVLTDFALGDK